MTTLKEALDQLAKGHELDNEQKKLIIDKWQKELGIQPCEDAISRADALKALDYDIKSFEFKSGVGRHMNEIANLLNTIYEIQSDNIKALPPVQPKPRTGHWIQTCEADENGNATYRCSKCGHTDEQGETKIIPFCWFCGCRMVKSQESGDRE